MSEKSESKGDKRIMCFAGNIFEITLKQMKLVCLCNISTDNICLPVLVKS